MKCLYSLWETNPPLQKISPLFYNDLCFLQTHRLSFLMLLCIDITFIIQKKFWIR